MIHETRSHANPGISLGTEVIVYEGIPYGHEKGATRTKKVRFALWSVNDRFASIVLDMFVNCGIEGCSSQFGVFVAFNTSIVTTETLLV